MPRQSRRPADLTVLKIREPGDLLEVVPYLLGFRPTDSMVLIGLASGRVGVTARLDLADAADARALSEIITVVGR